MNSFMKKLKIGIDIDNVIADSTPSYIARFNQAFGTKIRYEEVYDFYHLEASAGIEPKKAEEFFVNIIHTDDFQLSIPPYEEPKKVIKNWLKKGYSIHYITARPPNMLNVTKKWLQKHGFWVDGISLDVFNETQYKTDIEFKRETAKKLGIDIFIEDHREIAKALGVQVFLLDRPWNQGKMPKNIVRVMGWDEIERLVEEYAGKIYH